MNLDATDRRRVLAASALTLVALPALFWASDDDGAPNVATVGIEVGGDDGSNDGRVEWGERPG